MQDGPRSLVLSRAERLKAPVLSFGHEYDATDFVRAGYQGTCTIRVDDTTWDGIPLDSPAAFMATNAAHALAAYEVLRRRGLVAVLDADAIRQTFKHVRLPACCEVLAGNPTIVIDGAHLSLIHI